MKSSRVFTAVLSLMLGAPVAADDAAASRAELRLAAYSLGFAARLARKCPGVVLDEQRECEIMARYRKADTMDAFDDAVGKADDSILLLSSRFGWVSMCEKALSDYGPVGKSFVGLLRVAG